MPELIFFSSSNSAISILHLTQLRKKTASLWPNSQSNEENFAQAFGTGQKKSKWLYWISM
jgi:hypothetical protein